MKESETETLTDWTTCRAVFPTIRVDHHVSRRSINFGTRSLSSAPDRCAADLAEISFDRYNTALFSKCACLRDEKGVSWMTTYRGRESPRSGEDNAVSGGGAVESMSAGGVDDREEIRISQSDIELIEEISARTPVASSDADRDSETTPTDPPSPGSVDTYRPARSRAFGRYELLIEMGQGGMATLYLGRIRGPESFEKLLAVKKIHDHLANEEQFVRMFLDEAKIAALIHHPNVATIFDLGQADGSYYIAMEYIHGQNLTDILKQAVREPSRLPWPFVASIIADAASGLHAAHELLNPEGRPLNVVHRDVSPQNILVSYDGHVKIVDFGVAYAAEKLSQTTTGTLKGKVSYMSPEQTRGESVDRRSDIFSLGIVLYECLLKRRLFKRGNEAATLLAIRDAVVPPLRRAHPELPVALEQIVTKALAKDVSVRYQTAQDLADDLEQLLVDQRERVRRSDIASMMERFFHDRRAIKEEQIHLAQKSPSPVAIKGVGMARGTGTSIEMPVGSRSMAMTPRNTWKIVGIASVAAAVVAGLAVFLLRGAGKGGAEAAKDEKPLVLRKDAKAAVPSARISPERVVLAIKVFPKKAASKIHFRGTTYSGPVFQASLKRSTKTERILVTAAGYDSESLMIVPVQTMEMSVHLRRSAIVPRLRVAGRQGSRVSRRNGRRRGSIGRQRPTVRQTTRHVTKPRLLGLP